MVKQTIQIFARVKPSRKQSGIYSVEDEEPSSSVLEIIIPRELADGFVNNKRESYKFKFQKAFDQEAKQESVFDSIARPVAESVLAGYNGTIFAYGQTGSGKTFTITGGAERYNDRGIIPRTLSYIFEQLQKDSSKIYTTYISYLEIYNECGYDLLDHRHEASRLEDLPKVTIMEDTDQNIHLKNLSLQQATNEEEALNLLFLGDTNRMIAETPMNQASTRSHCIFTIHISSKEPGSATVRRSKLHLVDLAGSERVAKSGVGGLLLTEAKYINLSLHYLEQVIIALAERNRAHIPYRNSMMTSVLRDSLGGNCMTTMIATLSLDKRNIDESISTCRFAQRVALIKNEAVLNEEADPRLMIARLKKEIQALKDELAMVTGEQRTEELTQEELLKLEELMKVFLEDTDPECTLDVGADMRKIQHCFKNLKDLLNRRVTQDNQLISPESLEEKPVLGPGVKEEIQKLRELLHQRDSEIKLDDAEVSLAIADKRNKYVVSKVYPNDSPATFTNPLIMKLQKTDVPDSEFSCHFCEDDTLISFFFSSSSPSLHASSCLTADILVSMLKKEKKRAQDALLKAKGFASYSHTLSESGQRPPTPSQLHEMSDGDTLGQKPGFLHQKSGCHLENIQNVEEPWSDSLPPYYKRT